MTGTPSVLIVAPELRPASFVDAAPPAMPRDESAARAIVEGAMASLFAEIAGSLGLPRCT